MVHSKIFVNHQYKLFLKDFCNELEFGQSSNPDMLCQLFVLIHETDRFVSVSTNYLLDFGIFPPVWCFDFFLFFV